MIPQILKREYKGIVICNLYICTHVARNGYATYKVLNHVVDSKRLFLDIPTKQHASHTHTFISLCQPIPCVNRFLINKNLMRFWKRKFYSSLPRLEETTGYTTHHNGRDELVLSGDMIDGDKFAEMLACDALFRLAKEQRDLHTQVVNAVNDYMDSLERVGA